MLTRVAFLVVFLLAARAAAADPLDDLAAKAAAYGPVLWYESTPPQQIQPVIAAFNRRFPNVKLEYVRDTGGNTMAGRIIQERQSGGRTADVGGNGVSVTWQLARRQLLENVDWKALGIDQRLIASPFAVNTAAAIYVILYNTDIVPDAQAPRGWDDLADPRWQDRVGTWVRAGAIAELAAVWGEDRAAAWLERFVGLHPMLFKSTLPLAQQVASGEIPVGLGLYHTALAPIARGAPLRLVPLDPTPVNSIYSFVVKGAKNPDGARLLIAWLVTPEGARAYEHATGRGNRLIEGTETSRFLSSRQVAEFPPADNATYARIVERFSGILAAGGRQTQ